MFGKEKTKPVEGIYEATFTLDTTKPESIDQSQFIELPNGDFLGEYGVGSCFIDSRHPTDTRIMEVWLFDKEAIEVVTRGIILPTLLDTPENILTGYKHQVVQAADGTGFDFNTSTFCARATIVNFVPDPDGKHFKSITVKVRVELARKG